MALNNAINNESFGIFHGKKVLVTGHTGFKGSWLSFILNKLGANVYGASNSIPGKTTHAYHLLNLRDIVINSNHENIDVTSVAYTELLNDLKPDYVFHLAAQALVSKSYSDPKTTFETNVMGVLNLLEYLRSTKQKATTIIVTSDKCYKNNNLGVPFVETDELGGIDPYSASKAAAEILINSYRKSFPQLTDLHGTASCRAGNVFGGGDFSPNRLVPDLVSSLLENKSAKIRMPNATRPWTYVIDVLIGYLMLAVRLRNDPKQFSDSWNFAANGKLTVKEIGDILCEHLGYGEIIVEISELIGYEAELLGINANKANRLLNWTPKVPTEKALQDTIDWYKTSKERENMVEFTEIYLTKYLA